jgi:hypothetical protein
LVVLVLIGYFFNLKYWFSKVLKKEKKGLCLGFVLLVGVFQRGV